MSRNLRERDPNDLAVRMFIHGITQAEVAEVLGVSRTLVGYILSGKRVHANPDAKLDQVSDAIDEIIARRQGA